MGEKSNWQAFFDKHSSVYEDNEFTNNTLAEVDFLIEELKLSKGDWVLDIGCGTGRHSIELARRGYKVTGVDISEGMLAKARETAKHAGVEAEWIQADATKFKMGRQFDAVVCLCEGAFGLLSTGDDPIEQPLSILRNVSKALKAEGRCVFTVLSALRTIRMYTDEDVTTGKFNPLTLTDRYELAPREGEMLMTIHDRGFTPTELFLLFRLAGLKVEHIWGGTAGSWNRQVPRLDEIELMIVADKP